MGIKGDGNGKTLVQVDSDSNFAAILSRLLWVLRNRDPS
jgi:hypothetical protein